MNANVPFGGELPNATSAAVAAVLAALDSAAEMFPEQIGQGAAAVVVSLAPDGTGLIVDYGARTFISRPTLAEILRTVLVRLEAESN